MSFKETTMSNMRQALVLLTGAMMVALGTLAIDATAPSHAAAQDVQVTGPLAGQPAVRHMRQYRVNRFFVTPSVGYTLQDEFSRSLFFGGSIGFHFLDWLGLSVWGGAAPIDIDTDLTTQIANNGQSSDLNRLSLPTAAGFPNQVGRIRWGVAIQALFIPLRGKLSLFEAAFVDTDLYIIGGVAFFGLQERAAVPFDDGDPATLTDYYDTCRPDSGAPNPQERFDACAATQSARADRVTPAPMLGVGLSMMFNEFLGLQLEWRAFPFSWNPSGTDEDGGARINQAGSGFPNRSIGGEDSRVTFNHMVNIGVVVYLPTEVQITD